ncbi:hypothetical protein MMC27_004398 [Xylographa pallens]|nr:hypothetical protein [Xylographa pallens]
MGNLSSQKVVPVPPDPKAHYVIRWLYRAVFPKIMGHVSENAIVYLNYSTLLGRALWTHSDLLLRETGAHDETGAGATPTHRQQQREQGWTPFHCGPEEKTEAGTSNDKDTLEHINQLPTAGGCEHIMPLDFRVPDRTVDWEAYLLLPSVHRAFHERINSNLLIENSVASNIDANMTSYMLAKEHDTEMMDIVFRIFRQSQQHYKVDGGESWMIRPKLKDWREKLVDITRFPGMVLDGVGEFNVSKHDKKISLETPGARTKLLGGYVGADNIGRTFRTKNMGPLKIRACLRPHQERVRRLPLHNTRSTPGHGDTSPNSIYATASEESTRHSQDRIEICSNENSLRLLQNAYRSLNINTTDLNSSVLERAGSSVSHKTELPRMTTDISGPLPSPILPPVDKTNSDPADALAWDNFVKMVSDHNIDTPYLSSPTLPQERTSKHQCLQDNPCEEKDLVRFANFGKSWQRRARFYKLILDNVGRRDGGHADWVGCVETLRDRGADAGVSDDLLSEETNPKVTTHRARKNGQIRKSVGFVDGPHPTHLVDSVRDGGVR